MRQLRLALVAGLAASAIASPAADAAVRLVPVGNPVASPVWVGAPKGSRSLYAVSRDGVILKLRNGRWRTFLDIRGRVLAGGEQGLLSVAFHPQFGRNRLLYVNYTAKPDGATHVVEFRANRGLLTASARTARRVIRIAQPYSNHNGGQLQFGPDGNLWIGMGDGGAGDDPENRARNPRQLLGKMLRLDVSGRPYRIPAGNAYPGGRGGRAEIWALGLRNPWRFSFDRATSGDLWIADVGQGQWEEIDRVARGSLLDQTPRRNFGWDVFEGTHPHEGSDRTGLTFPVHQYEHGSDGCSVSGGIVYRGSLPGLAGVRGRYVFGDYCSGKLWTLRKRGARFVRSEIGSMPNGAGLAIVAEGGTGQNLYVAGVDAGRIWRIASAG